LALGAETGSAMTSERSRTKTNEAKITGRSEYNISRLHKKLGRHDIKISKAVSLTAKINFCANGTFFSHKSIFVQSQDCSKR
jgi:hypothetical protein